ncbi:hypothetical protein Cgig2_000214 [Carnegiea gigantea]|uniref:Uncharacterized protein n=1 Tax=Carnegiea gigantea TaxID=171969 RepID=A0A9Q1GP86_9CARY|nr:hypothetical protein Cgig2_000214 [Carnegiea gigantea]
MPSRPRPIETPACFKNINMYYEYNTTFKYHGLKKALNELTNQGQLNRFLRHRPGDRHGRYNPRGNTHSDIDRDMKVITIVVEVMDVKELHVGYRKSQICKLRGVIMTFGLENKCCLQTPHNDPLDDQLPTLSTKWWHLTSCSCQFGLNDGKIGRLNQRIGKECYYVSLRALSNEEKAHLLETSRPEKLGKQTTLKALVVFSTVAKSMEEPTLN